MSRKIPEVLTTDEQQALLRTANQRYRSGLRDIAMMNLMLNCGLRVSEVVNLRWQHVDLNSGKVTVVQGKGKKDRILWTNEETLNLLRRWRERKDVTHGVWVFPTLEGNQLSRYAIGMMLRRRAKKAKLEKHVRPHMLRHSFATDLYRASKDIRLTQKALGHSDLSTTMIYTHIVDDDLEHAMKTFRK